MSRKTEKIDQNHNMLWSSQKLTHRYMEEVVSRKYEIICHVVTEERRSARWEHI